MLANEFVTQLYANLKFRMTFVTFLVLHSAFPMPHAPCFMPHAPSTKTICSVSQSLVSICNLPISLLPTSHCLVH